MRSIAILALVIVAVVAACIASSLLLRRPSPPFRVGLPKVLITIDGLKTLGAAEVEDQAKSMAKDQFLEDHQTKSKTI